MAKKLSNKNQALLALGAAAAIGVFLYTRKKPATAGIGAMDHRYYNPIDLSKMLFKVSRDIDRAEFAVMEDEAISQKERRSIMDDLDKAKYYLAYGREKIDNIKPLPIRSTVYNFKNE
jgi:hypothetical protein